MPRPEGTGHVSGVVGAEAVVVREAATVVARRLARRRGLWMLLFGVVHGMAFAGDAIGTHALIATAFAGTVVQRKRVRKMVVGGPFILVSLGCMRFLGWTLSQGPLRWVPPRLPHRGPLPGSWGRCTAPCSRCSARCCGAPGR